MIPLVTSAAMPVKLYHDLDLEVLNLIITFGKKKKEKKNQKNFPHVFKN